MKLFAAMLPGHIRSVVAALAVYALATVGGHLFSLLNVPLPWMLGALTVVAALSLTGHTPSLPRSGRRVGQLVLGIGIGLTFTAGAVEEAARHVGAMVSAALLTLLAGAAMALPYRWMTRTDIRTALLACIPGGPADMAILAERCGGDPRAVAIAQTFRITIIVVTIPPMVALSGAVGQVEFSEYRIGFDPVGLAAMTGLSLLGVWAMRRLGLTSAWLLGGVAALAPLTANGWQLSSLPFPFIAAAQVLLGAALGTMFDRDFLRGAYRVLFGSLVCSVLLVAACSLLAVAFVAATGLPVASLIIALAPGSVTEMGLTARLMHLAVPLVTAFHVCRIVLILLLAPRLIALVVRVANRAQQGAPGAAD